MKQAASTAFRPLRLTAAAIMVAVFTPIAAFAAPSGKMGPESSSALSGQAAPDAAFLVHGQPVRVQTYHGHPLVLWQVATWCGSCKAGLKAFAHHQALIDKSDVKIVVLRDYKNGGYPGITISKFAKQVAPSLLNDSHFTFGNATKAMAAAYNPHHYVDIYQLITPGGRIAATSSAPSVTFGRIENLIKATRK